MDNLQNLSNQNQNQTQLKTAAIKQYLRVKHLQDQDDSAQLLNAIFNSGVVASAPKDHQELPHNG